MTNPVGRDEFNMLRSMVEANGRTLASAGGISVQLTEVIKDVADVKNDLASFRRDHEDQHRREYQARTTSRRWMIATLIAALAVIETPLLILVAHVH